MVRTLRLAGAFLGLGLALAPPIRGQGTQEKDPLDSRRWSPVPIANFSPHPVSGPAPLRVRFADRSFGEITSWSWSFGDGTTSTLRNPTHEYTEGGFYRVSLTVRGPDGSDTMEKPQGVIVTSCTL